MKGPAHNASSPRQRIAAQVSAVVIGRNEGERLRRCLASLAALPSEDRPCEVIYVDSGSTDGSLAIAAEFAAKILALRPERPTAALGRNAGWCATTGDFVLFLDGDTELAPDFLLRALPHFLDHSVAVVWGHRRELHTDASVYNRVLDLDWMYPPGQAEFCGGDALFRRSVLAKTGGFDDTLIAGEEPELCRRILAAGGTILHVDEAMTTHDLQITRFAQYWRRASRAGYAYAEVSSRFAGTQDPFWTEQARRNRWHAALLLGGLPAAFVCALLLHTVVMPGVLLVLFLLLAVRSAWKARWKSSNKVTLLLYGFHSHLQQIPIFAGQIRFFAGRRFGRSQGLVEYKDV